MRPPRSIQWRIALAYIGLILVAMAAVTIFLVVDLQDQLVVDAQGASAVNRIILTTVVATAIVAILAVWLAFLIARRSTRSIRSLTEASQRLAGGDLDHRVPAGSSTETHELAEAFNSMAANLKRMLTSFSTEHDKLSAILATMTDGVVLIDGQGGMALVNPAAQDLLSLPVAQGSVQRFAEVVRDHELNSLVSQCQASGELQHLEFEMAPGRHFVSVIATPMTSDIDEGVLLVLHDLTQARRVETTRREFVANVSHELRTPLASVRAAVETLENGALDETAIARQFLDRIHRDLDRMTQIVEDLLNLSRLESGEVRLNLRSIAIHRPILEAIELYREQALAQGVDLSMGEGDHLPPAVADEARLQQVLCNLLENAVKFTPPGGRVWVEARERNGEMEVSVKDTGVGIPPEHLPHAFERFYKVDRYTDHGGTGLGLAIAKHIVQAHGGRIWAESRVGEGSTFTFTVPAGKTES